MKTLKSIGDIANMHDLHAIPRTRRSGKPQLATTAVLELSMARNERDRLVKERQKLTKRKMQIDRRLPEIDKEMDELLEMARKKAVEIRGETETSVEINVKRGKQSKSKMVLEY